LDADIIQKVYSIYSFNNQLHIIGSYIDVDERHLLVLMKYNTLANNWIKVIKDCCANIVSPGNVA